MAEAALAVIESGRRLSFSFDEVMKYHGGESPGGVAHAFKVMDRAWPLLDPGGAAPERREVSIDTAFGGPGARDAFECVTRAVSDRRYTVQQALGRPERGRTLERFVFRLRYRERTVTLLVREGFVTDEFIDLARKSEREPDEERRLATLKREMAEHVMDHPAAEVYDVEREHPARRRIG
jgi:hypothetical protein